MTNELAPGALIAGKYQIERTLGEGGMGLVLQARHTQLGQSVAIKVIRAEAGVDEQASQRFLREAWAAATLTSEYVVRVFDVGVLPSGAPFMVMEYVEGQDLARLVTTRGPLPWKEALGYVMEACVGLAEAHARGIIHRDLKPSNLFLVKQSGNTWRIKVLDFGVAKAPTKNLTSQHALPSSASGSAMGLTGAGLLGTPYYMAPEQFHSARDVDVRADVWGMGAILFDLLTGAPPFAGDTLDQVITGITAGAPSVRQRRPDVPEELAQIIRDCLQLDLARRIPTIGRLAAALAHLLPSQAPLADRIAHMLGETPASFATEPTAHAAVFAPAHHATPASPLAASAPFRPAAPSTPTAVSPTWSASPSLSASFATSPTEAQGSYATPASLPPGHHAPPASWSPTSHAPPASFAAAPAPFAAAPRASFVPAPHAPLSSPAGGLPTWVFGLIGAGALAALGVVAIVGYLYMPGASAVSTVAPAVGTAPVANPSAAPQVAAGGEPLPTSTPRSVDIVAIYPAVEAAAKRKDPHARLINISAPGLVGGMADLTGYLSASYVFQSGPESTPPQTTTVSLSVAGMVVKQFTASSRIPFSAPAPRCSPAQLWQAGSPGQPQGTLVYSADPVRAKGLWTVIPASGAERTFDGATCREIQP